MLGVGTVSDNPTSDNASLGNVALIGAGVMGEAIASALVNRGVCEPGRIRVSDIRTDRLELLRQRLGVYIAGSNQDAARNASVVLLAVKPQAVQTVLRDIACVVNRNHLIVSIAAGVTANSIESSLPAGSRVIRAMPNTPGVIGMGITAISAGSNVSEEDIRTAESLFRSMGEVVVVDERLMDAVTGLSGSGPAYCFLFIEALADAGVLNGLPRDVSLKLACWTVLGAAALAKDSPDHPAVLKSKVTSPAGTTAAGLAVLERMGLRSAVIDAVTAATDRSRQLSSGNG